MPQPDLDETQRRILEFICRRYPFETSESRFEQRMVVCGELRLALHEYDAACGVLDHLRLIVTNPPYAHDCDFIAPTLAGRRAVSRPPQPGSLPWRMLEWLASQLDANSPEALNGEAVAQAAGLAQDAAGRQAFQTACQALFNWGWISRQAEGELVYAYITPTPMGRQQIAGALADADAK